MMAALSQRSLTDHKAGQIMILHLIRAIFVLAVLSIAISYAFSPDVQGKPEIDQDTGDEIGLPVFTKMVLVILVPSVLAVIVMLADTVIHEKSLTAISGMFFGVVAGVAMAFILGKVVGLMAQVFVPGYSGETEMPLVAMIKLLVGACAIYLCVSFVMQTKDDFRFIIPYLEFAKQTKGQRPLLLDTSVIIDGRVADIADTRILESPMIVPRFVLEELQEIADSGDKLKRN